MLTKLLRARVPEDMAGNGTTAPEILIGGSLRRVNLTMIDLDPTGVQIVVEGDAYHIFRLYGRASLQCSC